MTEFLFKTAQWQPLHVWKPKIVSILTDLTYKLIWALFSTILTQINSLSYTFLFFDLTIKFPSIKNHTFWIHIQETSRIFSINFILSITNHDITYDLSVLQYYFCVSSMYSHIMYLQSVKSSQTTSMINCHSYHDTIKTLQMHSAMPCCNKE